MDSHIVASFILCGLRYTCRCSWKKNIEVGWPDLMRDLKWLQAVHLELDGRMYRIRTDFEGIAYQAFKTAGMQLPGRVTQVN